MAQFPHLIAVQFSLWDASHSSEFPEKPVLVLLAMGLCLHSMDLHGTDLHSKAHPSLYHQQCWHRVAIGLRAGRKTKGRPPSFCDAHSGSLLLPSVHVLRAHDPENHLKFVPNIQLKLEVHTSLPFGEIK